MSDLLCDMIKNMSGHDNFQKWQDFTLFMARRMWPGCCPEHTLDKEGLFDIFVYENHEKNNDGRRKILAQLECKAYSESSRANVLSNEISKSLKERTKNLKDQGRDNFKSYYVTTLEIKEAEWVKWKKNTNGMI